MTSQENPTSPAETRENADKIILKDAFKFNELYAKGTNETLKFDDIEPGTYNENNGVIIGNVEGQVFALPSTPETLELIENAELRLEESIGVPNLNDAEYMWGSESERQSNSVFQEWKSLHQKYSGK
jgi:hypothetical protein